VSKVTISKKARIRAAFEADANSTGNLYNLTPIVPGRNGLPGGGDDEYWSIHTQRAWELYQKAFASAEKMLKEQGND
jgi:hypothetical protein